MSSDPKKHAGFRFPARLIEALDDAAKAHTGYSRTDLVQKWLAERAEAEGWITPSEAEALKQPLLRQVGT